jgi:peptidoglycan/LPS O-acetylase OafA/YrhL
MVGYIRSLDGLRAYAVIVVMLFHTNISYFRYGWIGVPIFFVLSGFLITNILIKSKGSLNYFSVFYIRRFLRIFPIYYLALFFVLLFAIYKKEHYNDWFYFAIYVQNFILSYNQWGIDFPAMFNHTWSLGIEEQFYCFWPIVVRKFSHKKIVAITAILILLAWVIRVGLSKLIPGNPLVWANTFSCLDMLLAGALLAYSLCLVGFNKTLFLSIVILVFFTIVYFGLSISGLIDAFLFQYLNLSTVSGQLFWMLLIPYICVLLLFLIHSNSLLNKLFFTNSVIVYIGKISYGVYLYHFIVFDILYRYNIFNLKDPVLAIVKIVLTLILAMFSWELLEKYVLRFKKHFVYKIHENSTVRQ